MKIKNKIAILLIALMAGQTSFAEAKDYYDSTYDAKKKQWMNIGKGMVKAKLKDGDSAKFRRVYYTMTPYDIPATCGEVNSKNSFGAYTGFQRFLSGGQLSLTYVEEQVVDFDKVWKELCL